MIAFRFMFPPPVVFVRRGGQFIIQYSFDLYKTKRNLFLTCRKVTQVIFKRSIFSSQQALQPLKGQPINDFAQCKPAALPCSLNPYSVTTI